ncbi:MAG: ribulose-phosphate 3-epimerase [Lachnospiraceae bacterium]|nr:ribulose-phosphate 3-epimerase [Lachnospiraceae bacterium]
MEKYLAPSLLSANFYNLENDLAALKDENVKYLHLDVMDGMFVPNISLGVPVIESIKKNTRDDYILDTHLMVERPERYITNFKEAGADILTIHQEATKDYCEVLTIIKDQGMKAGISVNPETDIKKIDDCLSIADLVLVMSVHPGFGGQKFIDGSLDKVKYLQDVRIKNGYKYMIEIDGGITIKNVKSVCEAGVDIVVAGSAVFKNDIRKNVKDFNNIIKSF